MPRVPISCNLQMHWQPHMIWARLELQVIAESGPPSATEHRPFYDFLEGCLRHKAEMVIFEAARAICDMQEVSSRWAPCTLLQQAPRTHMCTCLQAEYEGDHNAADVSEYSPWYLAGSSCQR